MALRQFCSKGENKVLVLLTPSRWPRWYAYVTEAGHLAGWKGDPGAAGYWIIEENGDGTFSLYPKAWPYYRMYMRHGSLGVVAGHWADNDQNRWIVNEIPERKGHFTFCPKKWPTWYMYMTLGKAADVRGWESDPGPQGYWFIRRVDDPSEITGNGRRHFHGSLTSSVGFDCASNHLVSTLILNGQHYGGAGNSKVSLHLGATEWVTSIESFWEGDKCKFLGIRTNAGHTLECGEKKGRRVFLSADPGRCVSSLSGTHDGAILRSLEPEIQGVSDTMLVNFIKQEVRFSHAATRGQDPVGHLDGILSGPQLNATRSALVASIYSESIMQSRVPTFDQVELCLRSCDVQSLPLAVTMASVFLSEKSHRLGSECKSTLKSCLENIAKKRIFCPEESARFKIYLERLEVLKILKMEERISLGEHATVSAVAHSSWAKKLQGRVDNVEKNVSSLGQEINFLKQSLKARDRTKTMLSVARASISLVTLGMGDWIGHLLEGGTHAFIESVDLASPIELIQLLGEDHVNEFANAVAENWDDAVEGAVSYTFDPECKLIPFMERRLALELPSHSIQEPVNKKQRTSARKNSKK